MKRHFFAAIVLLFSGLLRAAEGAGWDCDPVAWHRDGDAFVGANTGRALAPSPKGRLVRISARITPRRTVDPDYASIGVGVFDDLDRYWNFAILKGSEAKGSWHRYELKAQSAGTWGAEDRLMKRTVNKRVGEWNWDEPLDLSLHLSPERVMGVVTNPATGAEVYRCVWEAKEGNPVPVPAGRPCLFVSNDLGGRVEKVEWAVEDEVPDQTRLFPPYRPVGPETGISGTATGFFHMETIDGRDWAIDPLGRATVLTGTDWCTPRGSFCTKLGYSPYGRWVKEHYPFDEAWAEETAGRLGSWGFTCLPCGGDESLLYRTLAYANAADRLYFSHRMCRGDPDWRICEYRPAPCTAFPNVFHPDFEAACDWWARQRCAPYKDDPWLVGYFIDNELAWWGDVSANDAGGLFDAVAKKPATHPAKKALLKYLQSKAIDVDQKTSKAISAVPTAVKVGFLRLAAEKYFSVMAAAIRCADPNHMVMGCRFAGGPLGVHPVVMETAGKYCDIVSFNHYPWADLDQGVVFNSRAIQTPVADLYRAAHDLAGKPLFLTEWSFPALDTGRPCFHGAGQRFRTQAERVQASELYARTLLSLPFFAGYSFFRWVDEPALGIRPLFPEDSNYGLVSEEGVPYDGLVSMFTRVHQSASAIRAGQTGEVPAAMPTASGQQQASERERYFAEAAQELVTRHSSLVTPSSAVFASENGGRWSLSNGLVRLSGRVGGSCMADEISFHGGAPAGRWGALLQWELDGEPVWTDISRVTDVDATRDEATGIVSVTIRAEGGDGADVGEGAALSADLRAKAARFAFTHRLSLAPGADEILAEIVSLENTGSAPFTVQFLFMRPFAAQADPEEVDTVPNLWKGPVEDYWKLPDGTCFGVASTDPTVLGARLWRKNGQKAQHPDVRCLDGDEFTLGPGQTYKPESPIGARIRLLQP